MKRSSSTAKNQGDGEKESEQLAVQRNFNAILALMHDDKRSHSLFHFQGCLMNRTLMA